MKSVVLARTAAIAAVAILAGISCTAGADQPPTAEVAAQPAALSSTPAPAVPTSRPASDAIESQGSETQSLPTTQSLEDRLAAIDAAMAGTMPGEFPEAEEMPEPAMDSASASDVEGRAISAVPTPGAVDDQGNLPQPEPGDLLIDFTLPRAGGGEITLSEIGRDRYTVLVFYRAFW